MPRCPRSRAQGTSGRHAPPLGRPLGRCAASDGVHAQGFPGGGVRPRHGRYAGQEWRTQCPRGSRGARPRPGERGSWGVFSASLAFLSFSQVLREYVQINHFVEKESKAIGVQAPGSPDTSTTRSPVQTTNGLRSGPVDTSTGQLTLRHPGFGVPEDVTSKHSCPSLPSPACPQGFLLRSHRLSQRMRTLLRQGPWAVELRWDGSERWPWSHSGRDNPSLTTPPPQGALACILQRAAMSPGCRREPCGQARGQRAALPQACSPQSRLACLALRLTRIFNLCPESPAARG